MKKLLYLLIIVCLLALCVISCENPSGQPEGTGTDMGTEASAATDPETSAPATGPETDEETVPATELVTEPVTEAATAWDESLFEPVIRFVVCSDVHMSGAGSTEAKRFAQLFRSAYAYSESQTYDKLDAVIVVGDLTNEGRADELKAFKSVVAQEAKDETQVITVMGNHEYMNAGPAVYRANMDDEVNKHVVINGFHFIGISPSEQGQTYDAQVAWLKAELAAANEDDPAKPIFTFRHHHLQNTVYVSKTWFTASSTVLKAAYGKYPQVIDFSGDSHGPMNNPLSIWQDRFTMLGTGTLSYFEMETGMTDGTLPKGRENAAQYYIVEVDAENRVRIQPYNILTDSFFRTPSNTDDPEKQLVYWIMNPADRSTFTYTSARKKAASAPYFAEGAVPTASNVTAEKVTITVPQAFDDSCIYSYTLKITENGKTVGTYKYFSEYYFEPIPDTVSYTVTGLKPDTAYEASVTPVNAWDVEGEPITVTFKTEARVEVQYQPAYPVTYKWTFTDFEQQDSLTLSAGTPAYGGKATGDVFAGQWDGNTPMKDAAVRLAPGKGYNGSNALAVTKTGGVQNRAWYLFANEQNGYVTRYDNPKYLRVWVDFTGVDFRKACFGVTDGSGALFSTDDIDNQNNQKFYYLPEGSTQWKTYTHGNDGCFGTAQGTSLIGFKGWLAFPTADFGGRTGGGRFDGNDVTSIYMYWDFSENGMCGTEFYIDEISLVPDYKVFEPYQ